MGIIPAWPAGRLRSTRVWWSVPGSGSGCTTLLGGVVNVVTACAVRRWSAAEVLEVLTIWGP
jgi:hypothetical protein